MHPPSNRLPPSSPRVPLGAWVVCITAALVIAPLMVNLMPGTALAQTCPASTHQPGTDPEVLVLTTPTRMPQLCGRTGLELQNLGPNPIHCVVSHNSAHARVGRARLILAGGTWSIAAKDTQPIWCVSSSADQVAGAATIVSEVR